MPLNNRYRPVQPNIIDIVFHCNTIMYCSFTSPFSIFESVYFLTAAKYPIDIKKAPEDKKSIVLLSTPCKSVVRASKKTATETTICTINHHLKSNLESKFSIVRCLLCFDFFAHLLYQRTP